jgi:hypothetical protein
MWGGVGGRGGEERIIIREGKRAGSNVDPPSFLFLNEVTLY